MHVIFPHHPFHIETKQSIKSFCWVACFGGLHCVASNCWHEFFVSAAVSVTQAFLASPLLFACWLACI